MFLILFKKLANKFLISFGVMIYLINLFIPYIWILKNYCNYLIYFSLGLIVIKAVKSNTGFLTKPVCSFCTGLLFVFFSWVYAYEIIIDKNDVAYFLWLLPSTLGTAFFINTSINIKSKKFKQIFIHFGRNSLTYYVMHLIPLAAIRIFLLNYMHIENLWLVLVISFFMAIFSCYIVFLVMKKLKLTNLFFGR